MKKRGDTNEIELTKEQKAIAVEKLKEYISDNFEITAGNLQTGLLLDFISENIGGYYYNKAVTDCLEFIKDKIDDMYLLLKDEEENGR